MARGSHVVALAVAALLLVPQALLAAKKVPRLKGTIVAVHADKKSVEVEKKSGELQTFYFNDATKFTRNKAPITLADLTRDTKVSVHYKMQEGKMVATKVVMSAKK